MRFGLPSRKPGVGALRFGRKERQKKRTAAAVQAKKILLTNPINYKPMKRSWETGLTAGFLENCAIL